MLRKLVVLAAVALSGHSLADPVAANLKDFSAEDICDNPVIEVVIDGQEDKNLAQQVRLQIIRQDSLFGTGFFKQRPECSTFFSIHFGIMSIKNGSGVISGYTYSTDLRLQPFEGGKFTLPSGKTFNVIIPIVYDVGLIGVTGPLRTQLDAVVINQAESQFQYFVLDWRKSH